MLVQLLCQRGIAARVISTKTLSGEMLDQVEAESCIAVCVSALPPFAATHARYLSKRLKLRFSQLRIIVGLWQTVDIGERTRERLTATGIDMLVTTLADAVKESERASQSTIVESAANSTAV
jgi:hypothetical protein